MDSEMPDGWNKLFELASSNSFESYQKTKEALELMKEMAEALQNTDILAWHYFVYLSNNRKDLKEYIEKVEYDVEYSKHVLDKFENWE